MKKEEKGTKKYLTRKINFSADQIWILHMSFLRMKQIHFLPRGKHFTGEKHKPPRPTQRWSARLWAADVCFSSMRRWTSSWSRRYTASLTSPTHTQWTCYEWVTSRFQKVRFQWCQLSESEKCWMKWETKNQKERIYSQNTLRERTRRLVFFFKTWHSKMSPRSWRLVLSKLIEVTVSELARSSLNSAMTVSRVEESDERNEKRWKSPEKATLTSYTTELAFKI
jgi:hypothetical protein